MKIITGKVLAVVLGILIALELFLLLGHSILFSDAPAEFRDLSVVKITQEIANGHNPYSVDNFFEKDTPEPYLDSGFIHVLPAAGLSRLTGLPAHYSLNILNVVYYILAFILIYLCCKALTKSKVWSMFAVFLQFFFMYRNSIAVIRPDSLCAVLLLLIIYIELQKPSESHSSFTEILITHQDWIIAVCCVILAHLKPHYAVIVLPCLYIAYRRKCFKKLFAKGIVLAVVSYAIIYITCPIYFNEFVMRVLESFLRSARSGTERSINKWMQLLSGFAPIFIVAIIVSVLTVIYLRKKRGYSVKKILKKIFTPTDDYGVSFLVINIVVNSVTLCFMGKHGGAGLWYHYYMLMPSLVLFTFYLTNYLLKDGLAIQYLVCIIMLLSTVSIVYFGNVNNLKQYLSRDYYDKVRASIEKESSIISHYEKGNVLLTAPVSWYAINHNIYNYEYGDDLECIPTVRTRGPLVYMLPYLDRCIDKRRENGATVISNILNRKYEIVATTDGLQHMDLFDTQKEFDTALEANYMPIETIDVYTAYEMPNSCTFWIPKSNSAD